MKCPRCGYNVHVQPRNLEQNALAAVWYAQISKETGEGSPMDVKQECKLRFGIPILRAESEEFRLKYDRLIKPLPYETKLELMEWFPVTSLMTVGQFSRYMGDVQHHYAQRGIVLESINEVSV